MREGDGESEGGRHREKQRKDLFANMRKYMFIKRKVLFFCPMCMEKPQLVPVWWSVTLYVCTLQYFYVVSCLVAYFLLARMLLFVCVCHCCCISVQGLLATDGFHTHHPEYDSSVFLLFEGYIFLSGEGKETRTLLSSSCQLRWPQNCEQKTLEVRCCWGTFFFSLTFG